MIAAILFVSFAILLILGAPIAVCLGSSSVTWAKRRVMKKAPKGTKQP